MESAGDIREEVDIEISNERLKISSDELAEDDVLLYGSEINLHDR
jgi:hypothetical protein